MNKKIFFILTILFVMGFVFVSLSFFKTYHDNSIIIEGEIDAKIYNVSSKIPGRIAKIYVQKGDFVKKGDLVFSIISPEIEAKYEQALAAREAANAKKEEAYNGARKEQVKAAYNQWQKAKAARELMEKTYKRIEKLYKQGVISEQKKDEVYTKYKAAKSDEASAKELYMMAKKGAREELKKAATSQAKVYEAKVKEVESFLKETKAYAYNSGEVSEILINEGELAPSGFPVVVLTDMKNSWARFAIREDFLKYFKKGKTIKVFIPALNKSFDFEVSYISKMGEYATFKATDTKKGYELKSFEVHLKPKESIKNLRVGMSALVKLNG